VSVRSGGFDVESGGGDIDNVGEGGGGESTSISSASSSSTSISIHTAGAGGGIPCPRDLGGERGQARSHVSAGYSRDGGRVLCRGVSGLTTEGGKRDIVGSR